MDFFATCPVRVIEMVFSHLTKEILELTLISPRINKIISNSEQLMQHCRFKVDGRQRWLGTRKYSQLDFFDFPKNSVLPDVPAFLTQATFDECRVNIDVFYWMLSKISTTLELLTISFCSFYDGETERSCLECEGEETKQFPPLEFPRLKTLILSRLGARSNFAILSTIRASNLTELGLIDGLYKLDESVAKAYVDLILCNSQIKFLHIPDIATELFIAEVTENPQIEYNFVELSVHHPNHDQHVTFDTIINFLETQKTTLRGLRIGNRLIEERHVRRLLSWKLIRLEFYFCSLELSSDTVIENYSIESLALIGAFSEETTNFENLCSFVEKCKNLSALTVFITPPGKELSEATKSWQIININEFTPIRIPLADIRSVRYAGIDCLMECVRFFPNHHFYYKNLQELSVEKNPFSVLKFKERSFFPDFTENIQRKAYSWSWKIKEMFGLLF